MIIHVRFIRTNTPTDMHETCTIKTISNNTFVTMHFPLQIRPLIYNMTLIKYLLSQRKQHCNTSPCNSHYRMQRVLFCN